MKGGEKLQGLVILLILAGGMYLRAEGLWNQEVSHEQHYGFEAPFVLSNYYFFWKYHTHPGNPGEYNLKLEKHAPWDYRCLGVFPLHPQGHPTLFPLLLSLFPNRAEYHLLNPDSAKFLSKTPGGYVLLDRCGLAGIELLKTYDDGSVLLRSNIGDARAVSVLFGTLMVLVVYIVSKALYNTNTAYLSAVLVAFSPPVVDLVRLSDNESVLAVFLFTALFFYIRAFDGGGTRDFVLAGVLQGLAMGTKFTAFALFPIVLIYMAATRSMDRRVLYSFVISFAVLSVFSHPISALQEVLSPSDLGVKGAGEYIAGLNPYPLAATLLVILYLFIAKPITNAEKMMTVYLLFFALMPFLVSHRAYVLVPPAAVIISAASHRMHNFILYPR